MLIMLTSRAMASVIVELRLSESFSQLNGPIAAFEDEQTEEVLGYYLSNRSGRFMYDINFPEEYFSQDLY
jgi:hypothetical protein